MTNDHTEEAELEMGEAVEILAGRLSKIRTGKASPAVLDPVRVEYYGAMTPLKQLANVGAPEPRLLTVVPFDRATLGDIEKAIQAADLGLNPMNDGTIIRVPIPELTEERRRDLSKTVREYGEQGKIAVRKVRQQVNDTVKKADDLTDDERHGTREEVQKLTDRFCDEIDGIVKNKEAEIMEI